METIRIIKPLFGGDGLGFLQGKAVFVAGGIPGEKYSIGITGSGKDYDTAEIVGVDETSPHRIAPECPNFNSCGGCSYLHVSYDFELVMKKEIITDCLRRIAGMQEDAIPPIAHVRDDRFGYRSHASVKARGGKAGFFRKDTNDLVPFPETGCLLLAPQINSRLKEISPDANDFVAAIDHEGNCFLSDGSEIQITEKELGIIYKRDIRGFYQSNRFLRTAMLETVRQAVPEKIKTFMDIYCGIGFFSLAIAARTERGIGYDVEKKSIEYARTNASINRIGNVEFHALASSRIGTVKNRPELVIIDPPRAGADRKTRQTIGELEPARIIYISCNPSTFARDIRDFGKAGYELSSLTLIDMFPGTFHVETAGILDRR